ncbi:hypothetical protein D3C86_2118630 [compost metagenome]
MIPFGDVVLNTGAAAPEHKFKAVAKFGVMLFVTVTFNVVPVAHCPAFGVKT